jgi:hypothetical protein
VQTVPRVLIAVCTAAALCCSVATTTAFAVPKADNMYPVVAFSGACQKGTNSGFGPPCQTDNSSLTVHIESSITRQTNIRNTLSSSYDSTNLDVSYPTVPVYTGPNETDIIYLQDQTLPVGVLAATWCDDPVSQYGCDQQKVGFNSPRPDRPTACHETGHAVGLLHPTNADPHFPKNDPDFGCLTVDAISDFMGSLNKYWVNATYPAVTP